MYPYQRRTLIQYFCCISMDQEIVYFLLIHSIFIPKFASSSPKRLGDDEVLSGQTLDVEGLSCSVKWEWNPTGTDGIVSPAYDNDDCKMR